MNREEAGAVVVGGDTGQACPWWRESRCTEGGVGMSAPSWPGVSPVLGFFALAFGLRTRLSVSRSAAGPGAGGT
jgi:hypothetical protein